MPNIEPTLMIRRSFQAAVIIVLTVQILGRFQCSFAHEGHQLEHQHSKADQKEDQTETRRSGELKQVSLSGPNVEAFEQFSRTVSTRVVGQYLVIESNGLPDHQMMVGIRSWQQQVPLPQPFTGENAWRLPMKPILASNPISVLKEPLRGAIALAVNGVPIFCALNNRGDDTYLAGELDEWGGHCGRGDDYHYHIAPVHLEDIVGVGNPIGYALDGYPILGFVEADGSVPTDLDEFNGHKDSDDHYHYHATQTFPYINGGLRGAVTIDGDQIKQPRDSPVRPSQSPLPGATITGFSRTGDQFDLEYEIAGSVAHVKYSLLTDNQVEFSYVKPSGDSAKVIYRRSEIGTGPFVRTYGFTILLVLGFLAAVIFVRKYYRALKST